VIISGTISVNGDDGIVDANDGAGGGAGGGVLVIAGTLTQTGRILASGGDGGVVDDGGGGGGGGRIKLLYVQGTVTRRALVADGGRGDGNGYNNDGRRGTICIETIPATETPTTQPSSTPSPTPTASSSPTPSPTATETLPPTPTNTPTVAPTSTATATSTATPADLLLPLLLRERCPMVDRQPIALTLVIDASTSMTGLTSEGRTKLEAALEAALVPIDMLEGVDTMALVTFNDTAHLLSGLTADRDQLTAALARVEAAPGSRLDEGIRLAHSQLSSTRPSTFRHLVVLTDGLPNPSTPEDALRAAEAARESEVVISTIGLGADVDAQLLRLIAGSPDRYYEAPDAEDLRELFALLAWRPPPCGGVPTWPHAQ